MNIDDFAPNLSFFFSNGMDAEYSVIGRVARRIWAKAMKYKYKANKRSQMLKYHVQTSARSLPSFSPMPEAIFGIQLIPLNEGSVYRANRAAASARNNELRSLAGGAPRMWGDLFVADLAVGDPAKARTVLAGGVPREPSTGRAITRYWIELQSH